MEECYGFEYSNQSPYFDNLRVGLVPAEPIDVESGEGTGQPPIATQLLLCTPNPFSPSETLRYTLGQEQEIALTIFDVSGALIQQLVTEQRQSPGEYRVTWDGTNASGHPTAPGTYFIRLDAGGQVKTKRVVLIR